MTALKSRFPSFTYECLVSKEVREITKYLCPDSPNNQLLQKRIAHRMVLDAERCDVRKNGKYSAEYLKLIKEISTLEELLREEAGYPQNEIEFFALFLQKHSILAKPFPDPLINLGTTFQLGQTADYFEYIGYLELIKKDIKILIPKFGQFSKSYYLTGITHWWIK